MREKRLRERFRVFALFSLSFPPTPLMHPSRPVSARPANRREGKGGERAKRPSLPPLSHKVKLMKMRLVCPSFSPSSSSSSFPLDPSPALTGKRERNSFPLLRRNSTVLLGENFEPGGGSLFSLPSFYPCALKTADRIAGVKSHREKRGGTGENRLEPP